MDKLIKIIKKKRFKRRFSALWIFLLMVEFVCPAFGHDATMVQETANFHNAFEQSIENKADFSKDAPLMVDCSEQHEQQTGCYDECLCHAFAIPSVNTISISETATAVIRIPHRYSNTIFNSLPPPYLPPKHS